MVVAPYPLELPSPATPPTPARATSLDHESTTMEISSAVREPHLDETEAPDAGITPEKEKQGDSLNEGSPPPTSTSVQFIGINYVPDSTDVQRAPRPPPLHPTPWESGATSRSSEDHVVIGLSTFPPKPCVLAFLRGVFFFHLKLRRLQAAAAAAAAGGEASHRAGVALLVWVTARGLGVLFAACGTDWGAPPAGDCSRGAGLYGRGGDAIFVGVSFGVGGSRK